jgi:hypothetical protein
MLETAFSVSRLKRREENRRLCSVRRLLSVGVSEVFQAFRLLGHNRLNNRVFPVNNAGISCMNRVCAHPGDLRFSRTGFCASVQVKELEDAENDLYFRPETICSSLCFGNARVHLSLRNCTNLSRT